MQDLINLLQVKLQMLLQQKMHQGQPIQEEEGGEELKLQMVLQQKFKNTQLKNLLHLLHLLQIQEEEIQEEEEGEEVKLLQLHLQRMIQGHVLQVPLLQELRDQFQGLELML